MQHAIRDVMEPLLVRACPRLHQRVTLALDGAMVVKPLCGEDQSGRILAITPIASPSNDIELSFNPQHGPTNLEAD